MVLYKFLKKIKARLPEIVPMAREALNLHVRYLLLSTFLLSIELQDEPFSATFWHQILLDHVDTRLTLDGRHVALPLLNLDGPRNFDRLNLKQASMES